MSGHSSALRALTDEALRARFHDLARQERENAADIVEHLMEVDRREGALDWGYHSFFDYCVRSLGYSEQAAFSRIRAARAARRFPQVLERLRAGRLHMDAVARLSPYLTPENEGTLLQRADGAEARCRRSAAAAGKRRAREDRRAGGGG